MLDAAGYPDTTIVLSNNLDELVIWQILAQIEEEAPRYGIDPDRLIGRLAYGVGTRLITSRGQSALDGVYKLVAVGNGAGWTPAIKISESVEKTLNPGHKGVWRLYDRRGKATADLLSLMDEDPGAMDPLLLHHPADSAKLRTLNRADVTEIEPLLEEVLRDGRLVRDLPSLEEIRQRRRADLERLDPGVKRLVNPHRYHVSLTERLWKQKQQMIEEAVQGPSAAGAAPSGSPSPRAGEA
jgi:nicotinate phosphoribosyltransferase